MECIDNKKLIDQILNGKSPSDVVQELIIGIQTPPPENKRRNNNKKHSMGGGIQPNSAKQTSYPGEPGSDYI